MSWTENFGTDVKPQAPGSFTLVPEGWYGVELIDFVGTDEPNGERKMTIRYKITEIAEGADDVTGQTLFETRYFKRPSSKGYNKHWLHMIGQPYEGEPLTINPQAWLGAKVQVRVKHNIKGEKTYANIVEYVSLVATSPEPDDFKNS